jgi:hypothetical protein
MRTFGEPIGSTQFCRSEIERYQKSLKPFGEMRGSPFVIRNRAAKRHGP